MYEAKDTLGSDIIQIANMAEHKNVVDRNKSEKPGTRLAEDSNAMSEQNINGKIRFERPKNDNS